MSQAPRESPGSSQRRRDQRARKALARESNPPSPWRTQEVQWIGEPPEVPIAVLLEDARSILSENESPDVPFRYSLNPYRGCSHACAYCYARPTHEWLGFGAGTDFDRILVVKRNAPELLDRTLARGRLGREPICLSGNTDPYQPLEAAYRLTRGVLKVLLRHRHPALCITKGSLVRRDAELWAELARTAGAVVHVSIPTLDERVARLLEPGAPSPAARLATLAELSRAGVPTGVAVAPLILGLSDAGVAEVLEAAARAGAQRAFHVPLRLAGSTAEVFVERLRLALPERAEKVLAAQREMREGKLNESRFGARMGGVGARYRAASDLFHMVARRLGLAVGEGNRPAMPAEGTRPGHGPAKEPPAARQGLLFDP